MPNTNENDDVPRTPLLESGGTSQFLAPPVSTVRRRTSRNSSSGSTSSQVGPRQEGVPVLWPRKRNKTACAGIIIFGGIILVALVIVGIKQATAPGEAQIEKLRSGDESFDSSSDGPFTLPQSTTPQITETASKIPETSTVADFSADETMKSIDETTQSIDVTTSKIDDTTTKIEETTPKIGETDESQEESLMAHPSGSIVQKADLCEKLKDVVADVDPLQAFNCSSIQGVITLSEEIDADVYIQKLSENVESKDILDKIQELVTRDDVEDQANYIMQQVNLLLAGKIVVTFKEIKSKIETLTPDNEELKRFFNAPLMLTTEDPEAKTLTTQGNDTTPEGRLLSSTVAHCDPRRELRCRDKSQCYPRGRHCDFQVDCKDFSDEDSCSCIDRLIDARKCDGYIDCPEGEDETGCDCEGNQFFCMTKSIKGDSECIDQMSVCDGVTDCSNGRDEEDCMLLFDPAKAAQLKPANSDKQGLLSIKTGGGYKFLGIANQDEKHISVLAERACFYLSNVKETLVKLVEFSESSNNLVKIGQFDQQTGRFGFGPVEEGDHLHLLVVQCILSPCNPQQSKSKRGHDRPEEFSDMTGLEIEKLYLSGNMDEEDLPGSEGKIVGGLTSSIKTWPSTVSIYRNGKFICGGTLIHPQWIITAGHCLYKSKDHHYRIRAGMQRKQSQSPWEQNRDIREVYIHNSYDSIFLSHDVSLGKLDRPISINKYAQYICLPYNAEMTPTPGSSCTAAGWGLLSERGTEAEELKEVLLPILDDCWRTYNNISYQICAGSERGRDSCQGDSGGPLYCFLPSGERYLGGVISHGKGCGRQGEPGVYVRLSVYYEWIESVLAGNIIEEEQIYKDQPLQGCPGLVCGTGECLRSSDLCDESVDCLDNEDVRGCRLVDGEIVHVAPEKETLPIGQDIPSPDVTGGDGFVEAGHHITHEKDQDDHKEDDHDQDHDHDHDHDHETEEDQGEHEAQVVKYTTELQKREGNKYAFTALSCDKDEYKCRLVEQCIPSSMHCDGVFDCIDRSDEIGCTCGEKMSKIMPKLVGDGTRDCRDGSDEPDVCSDGEYRCSNPGVCLERERVCDTVDDCPNGEDERNCAILVNDDFIPVMSSGDLVKNSSGFLIIQSFGNWRPVCVSSFNEDIAKSVCSYMGYRSDAATFSLVSNSEASINILNDYYGGASCSYVTIICEEQCGTRLNPRTEMSTPQVGVNPWDVMLMSDGNFICGGTLIHPSFVLTSRQCGLKVLRTVSRGHVHHTVLAGQGRNTPLGLSPRAQIRRVLKFKAIPDTNVAIGYVESAFVLNDYVAKICLPTTQMDLQGSHCQISGALGLEYSFVLHGICKRESEENFAYCSCSDPSITPHSLCKVNQHFGTKDPPTNTLGWSGALACPDDSGKYVSVGLYNTDDGSTPTSFYTLTAEVIRTGIPGIIESTLLEQAREATLPVKDSCAHRCLVGNCVAAEAVCDGTWDCVDGSDEASCTAETPWPVCRREVGAEGQCTCPPGYGKCKNAMCLPMDLFCNNVDDCGDESDEGENCTSCVNRLRFESPSLVCDGSPDCGAGEDEAPDTCGCPDNSFRCNVISQDPTDSSNCTPIGQLCDGKKDCNSGKDEATDMCTALGSKFYVNQNDILEPKLNQNGYLKMRLQGKWYTYCHQDWNDTMSRTICTALGFSGLRISQQYMPFKVYDLGLAPGLPAGQEASSCKLVYIVCAIDS